MKKNTDISKMISPVRCNYCRSGVYDLAAVKVMHCFSDCTTYKTPCCNTHADDREWVSLPAFRRLKPYELESIRDYGHLPMTIEGDIEHVKIA